ncbi:MAG TPA: alanine dehydrogenase, partial [Bacteroidetes bacterium]|nr:alanine dehydrogenase [Bacteroidota bacterium]
SGGTMNIGVPRERRVDEHRVGLTPAVVELLTSAGHVCYVEDEAGVGAGFSNVDYERAGAKIVYSPQEAYGRANLIVKVSRPMEDEVELVPEGSILMGFLHLAVARQERVQTLLDKRITAIAYDTIQNDDGTLPVQTPLSKAAGLMAPQLAGVLMQNNHGGKGILLGGVPGVPPAEVVIIGAGTFGTASAHAFLGAGASVYVLDQDLGRLQYLDERCRMGGRLVTMVSHSFNIAKVIKFADVVVGAVLVPGARAPIVITREMVRTMKPRSVILDISIDQGGCVETSRPTSHTNPTFVDEGVIHYCVPNMTSVVARTATHALNNAAWPFIREIAQHGLESALTEMTGLKRGVATHHGHIVNPALAASLGLKEVAL